MRALSGSRLQISNPSARNLTLQGSLYTATWKSGWRLEVDFARETTHCVKFCEKSTHGVLLGKYVKYNKVFLALITLCAHGFHARVWKLSV